MEDESMKFFNKYLLDIDQIKYPREKIDHLNQHSTVFSPKQRETMLKAAEALISRVPSLGDAPMMSRIADGYLSFDPQKSRDILKNYETNSSKSHFAIAAVAAIALGTLYFYPESYRFLSIGAKMVSILT